MVGFGSSPSLHCLAREQARKALGDHSNGDQGPERGQGSQARAPQLATEYLSSKVRSLLRKGPLPQCGGSGTAEGLVLRAGGAPPHSGDGHAGEASAGHGRPQEGQGEPG